MCPLFRIILSGREEAKDYITMGMEHNFREKKIK